VNAILTKKQFFYPAMVILLAVFVTCGYLLVRYYADGRRNERVTEELRALAEEAIPALNGAADAAPEAAATQPEPAANGAAQEPTWQERLIAELQQRNPDAVAWLVVEGTEINYPIVQGDDNEFYLKSDFEKKQNNHGAIFMDYRNNAFADYNTILYGHNMRDKTMFGALGTIGSKLAEDKGRILTVNAEEVLTWEIFSARTIAIPRDIGVFSPVYGEDQLARVNGLNEETGAPELTDADQILTLSTCKSGGGERYRYILQARLIEGGDNAGGQMAS
jgi:sortase B